MSPKTHLSRSEEVTLNAEYRASPDNEKRFRALIENGLDQIAIVTADGTLLWESPSTLRALGYPANEHVGQSIFLLVHPDDLDAIQQELAALLREPGGRRANTFRLRHADGTWRWIEGVASNLLHEQAIQGIVLNYRDVTERRQAEEQLRKSAERYLYLFENNSQPMWVYDLHSLAFLAVNDAAVAKYGYSRDEFLRMTIAAIRPEQELPRLKEVLAQQRPPLQETDGWKHQLKDGTLIDVKISSHVMDFDGRACALVVSQDVTETRKAEARARYATRLYAMVSQVNQAIVRVRQRDELFQRICDVAVSAGEFRMAWIGLLQKGSGAVVPTAYAGYEEGYLQSVHIDISDPTGSQGPTAKAIRSGQAVFIDDVAGDLDFAPWRAPALERGYRSYAAIPLRQRGEVVGNLALYAPEPGFFNQVEMELLDEIGQDISFALDAIEAESERLQAAAELKESERRHRDLLSGMMEGCTIIDYDWRFIYVNETAAAQVHTRPEALLMRTMMDTLPGCEHTEVFRQLDVSLHERRPQRIENEHRFPDGSSSCFELSLQPVPEGLFILSIDITERKRAEQALRESEATLRGFLEQSQDAILITDEQGTVVEWSQGAHRLTGYQRQESVGKPLWDVQMRSAKEDLRSPVQHERVKKALQQALSSGRGGFLNELTEAELQRPEGSRVVAQTMAFSIPTGKGYRLGSILRDVTEVRRTENALHASEERFRKFFELGLVGMGITSPAKGFVEVNDRLCEMLGYGREELLALTWDRLTHPEDLDTDLGNFERLLSGELEGYSIEKRFVHKSGRIIHTQVSVNAVRTAGGALDYCAVLLEDISERKQADARIQQQLDRITGLREVDRVITSSFDLRLTMNSILAQLRQRLGTDACAISLLDPVSSLLNCIAADGLPAGALSGPAPELGKGLAGKTVMELRPVHYPNLRAMAAIGSDVTSLLENGLTDYYGIPLISKGQVKGILEVFNRSVRNDEPDWLEYLETLAGQAAIAVDNIQMLEGLNRSNLELTQAYDATIEGWSRALDLRDKETEGHTRRVTELTTQLARVFGIEGAQLTNIRWGAMLHDIGKMGIPDSILLKPGELSPDEWIQMRKHPQFAYEMLAPIQYLRGALDIPFCHHEKWDGTGYPRGLQGEQIPLAARLFAIVDIWDALRSDRPYRPAWSEQKALEHVKGLAGTHLDPQVVKAFFDAKMHELKAGRS